MIKLVSILPIISASISGAIAAFHLILFFRKPDFSIYKKFSIAAAFVTLYGISSFAFYSANTVEAAINWRRLQASALSLFTIFYLDFIIDYINFHKKFIFRFIQITAIISVVLQFVINSQAAWSGAENQRSFLIIFSKIFVYYDITPGIISQYLFGIGVFTYFYVFFITYKQKSHISGRKQTLIILSVIILFLGFVNDTLISFHVLNSIFLLSISLLLTVGLSTYSLLDTILEDARLKEKLEIANQKLETLTTELEQRVQKRTVELSDQAEFFQSLINNNPVAIAIMDNQEKIIQTNHMFEEIFEYSNEETVGKQLDFLISPQEYYENAISLTQKVMNNEKVSTSGIRITKHGTLVNVDILGVPVFVNGKKVGALGMYQDITTRIEAEKLLIDSESRYRSLFFDSPISLVEENYHDVKKILISLEEQGITNLESYLSQNPELVQDILKSIKIIRVNRAALNLYQTKNEKEHANHFAKLIPKVSFPIIARELSAFMKGSKHFVSEMDILDLNLEFRNVKYAPRGA